MILSPDILAAIDAAVKAQTDGTVSLDVTRGVYQATALMQLESGVSESQIIAEFQQISNPTNQ